ncbi:50S ribosomal protein L6 [Candidatus Uhrbacteria bacterium RIFCSPHIGHO2_01_FULL_63_20]|uniref:Large ribosomal subunit protein uL6 n=1 Tax=Candidatus Uhrbacteria bacterium RIFCSPHIGHO2_01_FULL_63_20 TaxID=1802385 RepID=A0A1F7TNR3_9BACT|nr:MAG: 50S ribosomal protein L6 [Candidatus Uhrbacteria bacterium RIFCSPHIGHO2_01_FULL_63_20]
MSRVGKKPIVIPPGVEVKIEGQDVAVKGPLGSLRATLHPAVTARIVDADGAKTVELSVANPDDVSERALWGTWRANLANMVQGVKEGYSKSLEVNGVGFRVNVSGKKLVFALGFSHDVDFQIPEGITAKVDKNVVTVSGADKILVGETAASIRSLKKPEPYKGKGIKYVDEVIRRKAGKTAGKTAE